MSNREVALMFMDFTASGKETTHYFHLSPACTLFFLWKNIIFTIGKPWIWWFSFKFQQNLSTLSCIVSYYEYAICVIHDSCLKFTLDFWLFCVDWSFLMSISGSGGVTMKYFCNCKWKVKTNHKIVQEFAICSNDEEYIAEGQTRQDEDQSLPCKSNNLNLSKYLLYIIFWNPI